ncbi:unnamed protein product [Dovyalis caffra]|uniref:GST N-terminal domain-containing protein n=1 Tax=Dovyalis caffra TaxID=77055 RepID=A0AAV1RIV6_9ROSI|nr:unnamed protein product [Dovyalis caffra]
MRNASRVEDPRVNKIDFEEVGVELVKGQHLTPQFKEINPMGKVPAIVVDGKFKLFESHAILIFLASAFPGVADHCVFQFDASSAGFVQNTVLAPVFGRPLNPQAAAEAEKVLSSSLSKIEAMWLKESGRFLLGSSQPSIADLSLVCEIMQLEFVDETDRTRILGPYKKVQQWVEDTKNATKPHFDEVHQTLFGAVAKLQKQPVVE